MERHRGEQCLTWQQGVEQQQQEQHLHPQENEQGQKRPHVGYPKNAWSSHKSTLPSLLKSNLFIIAWISLSK